MAYIIDLTLIMQNSFWLTAIYHAPVSPWLVKVAAKAYRKSVAMAVVHDEIKGFVKGANIIDHAHRDEAIGQIIGLINRYRIDSAKMFELKDKFSTVDVGAKADEPWEVQTDR
jgi:hypothetical protein